MRTLCFVVSTPLTASAFLRPHMRALGVSNRVSLVANTATADTSWTNEVGVRVLSAPIVRPIAPLRDLVALLRLVRLLREYRFDIVHSVTPKAGLLAMLAARIARVPIRIHTFTGQVWATRRGPARAFLRAMDRLIASCATHVLVDSRSQRDFLIANRVVTASKSSVLGDGSICGVDAGRFKPDEAARQRVRHEAAIPDDAVVFLFLGRLSRDKGVLDLARAFAALASANASAYLALVGPDEEELRREIGEIVSTCADRVRHVDYTARPQDFMAAADVFCLPSYREGFGQVALEAAACGLPVIASRIYGVVDAVSEGESGLLHPPGDVPALRAQMETLLRDAALRARLGGAGRERALRDFSAARITQALLDYYGALTPKL